MSSNLKFPPT